MRRKSLTKEQREIQIINVFQGRVQDDNWSPASLSQIARGIGMSPSSHLRKIVDKLVDDGLLLKAKLVRSGRWDGWGYKPKKSHFKRPSRTAVVNFTQNGIRYKLEMPL